MRRPAVAGYFYPSNPESLLAMLREFADKRSDEDVVAIVSPHAGYVYSGRTAGAVHSLLPDVETYVIIGPNHTGLGAAVAVSYDDWMTPIGVVETDREFIDAMPKKICVVDEIAHREEHSLEVQVPFLQYLHKDFKIVAICMGLQDKETAEEIVEEILEAQEITGRRIALVASSDMHHYLPDDECRRRDEIVIEAILSMDVDKYYNTIYKLQASVCGYGPIAVAMLYSKELGAKAELVHYSTSGDVADRSQVVGYAGIAFRV
ncbi:MEMO1 family protein [Ferroglobus sp.]|uniref:MEMO1 family protein n=1 Tax=Ferroglobus sp. TaxID=2614230 RepID=UPI0025BDA0FE|nr:MEMO1 family protein [Ferroglobus sp.]